MDKVGRIWATLSNRQRIDLFTLSADGAGYSSPGQAWRSRAEYDASRALTAAWVDFNRDLRNLRGPPEHLTIDCINAMRKAIGLDIISYVSAPPTEVP